MPRRVLKVILSIESGQRSQKQQTVQQKQASLSAPSAAPATHKLPVIPVDSSHSKVEKALSIIAEESGLAVDDLTDGTVFADVGVDSLLGLTISARLKEDLGFELDFNGFFYEYTTVGDLKSALKGSNISTTGVSTPRLDNSGSSASTAIGITVPATSERTASVMSQHDVHRALQIISEESGLAVEELTDDTNFADAGVDSLLSLVIASRFRDELDFDIQHEILLLECPTVADLKRLLVGEEDTCSREHLSTTNALPISTSKEMKPASTPTETAHTNGVIKQTHSRGADLTARKQAVDEYVHAYTTGFTCPSSSCLSQAPRARSGNKKVVLVTGGTGSLGGHLVYHLAQLPDVETVVCLNRKNRAQPYDRQYKAMRSKGIRFPENLKPKLLVLQTDTSRTMLGLSKDQYATLVGSVTHLIHNAWPMSAKRPLAEFESQFQTMRNLLDFASSASSCCPKDFKFTFQMVSSIGVVGHYKLDYSGKVTKVPEERVDIDSVLPNGYGDAKWGCERMLDETLHRHPDRFRAMAVRLGQIAGSKTSGYWNPMEHFGFLIKSSQTLRALPESTGIAYWTPVNDVATTLSDLALSTCKPYPIYHVENPVGQPWSQLNAILSDALGIPNLIPFDEWVERVRAAPQHNNPASTLLEFLDNNYLRMSCGGLVLDVKKCLEHSKSLTTVGAVSEEVVRKYVHIWKEIGFLA